MTTTKVFFFKGGKKSKSYVSMDELIGILSIGNLSVIEYATDCVLM